MVNFKKLTDKAKDAVEKRGGTDALKQDAAELRDIARGEGTLKEKAKRAADALKDSGGPGAEDAPPAAEAPPAPSADPAPPPVERDPAPSKPDAG